MIRSLQTFNLGSAATDNTNGKSRMMSGKKQKHPRGSSSFHAVSRYAFFNREPKWPPSKTQLTYAFAPGTRTDASGPTDDHGDGHPFDGPKGILAHSFAPTDGRFHYDGSENWAVGAKGI
ncbi:hypothetical protein CRYUN_Cryun06bG0005300 [Craigia yunnanensis]